MSHQVLYRKYRPRDFSEIVGQEYAVKAITNAISSDRVAHAYLFAGPRGIGKTTIARLIAKAVNCVGGGARPCNACDVCVDVNENRFLDLVEIDAASNRGIDEIRSLREAVRFVPARGKKKVYIIDECHMLTKEASTALLKTLEEPPEHAIFILATTELEKLTATIISRTQLYHFTRPTILQIAGRVSDLAKREKVTLDSDAADLIALFAEGALRDAESMLGQIMALEDAHITRREVETLLGAPPRDSVRTLFSHLVKKDAGSALGEVEKFSDGGYDFQFVIKLLLRLMRAALVLKSGSPTLHSIEKDLLPEEILFLREILPALNENDLSRSLLVLLEAHARMKFSPIPELPLELAVVEIAEPTK